ncbi:2743_t:CDS:2, partial [Acaulospora colombiana]
MAALIDTALWVSTCWLWNIGQVASKRDIIKEACAGCLATTKQGKTTKKSLFAATPRKSGMAVTSSVCQMASICSLATSKTYLVPTPQSASCAGSILADVGHENRHPALQI